MAVHYVKCLVLSPLEPIEVLSQEVGQVHEFSSQDVEESSKKKMELWHAIVSLHDQDLVQSLDKVKILHMEVVKQGWWSHKFELLIQLAWNAFRKDHFESVAEIFGEIQHWFHDHNDDFYPIALYCRCIMLLKAGKAIEALDLLQYNQDLIPDHLELKVGLNRCLQHLGFPLAFDLKAEEGNAKPWDCHDKMLRMFPEACSKGMAAMIQTQIEYDQEPFCNFLSCKYNFGDWDDTTWNDVKNNAYVDAFIVFVCESGCETRFHAHRCYDNVKAMKSVYVGMSCPQLGCKRKVVNERSSSSGGDQDIVMDDHTSSDIEDEVFEDHVWEDNDGNSTLDTSTRLSELDIVDFDEASLGNELSSLPDSSFNDFSLVATRKRSTSGPSSVDPTSRGKEHSNKTSKSSSGASSMSSPPVSLSKHNSIEELREQLESMKKEVCDQVAQMNQAMQDKLSQELEKHQKTQADLMSKTEAIADAVKGKNAKIAMLEADLEAAKTELSDANKVILQSRNEVKVAKKVIKDQMEEIDKHKQSISKFESEGKSFKDKIKSLNSKLKSAQAATIDQEKVANHRLDVLKAIVSVFFKDDPHQSGLLDKYLLNNNIHNSYDSIVSEMSKHKKKSDIYNEIIRVAQERYPCLDRIRIVEALGSIDKTDAIKRNRMTLNQIVEEIGELVLDECLICLEPMMDQILKLPCQHPFHESCIRQSLAIKNECPKCRKYILLDDDFPQLA